MKKQNLLKGLSFLIRIARACAIASCLAITAPETIVYFSEPTPVAQKDDSESQEKQLAKLK